MLRNTFPTADKPFPQQVKQEHQCGYSEEEFGLLRSLPGKIFNQQQRSFFRLSHQAAVCFKSLTGMEVDVAMSEQAIAELCWTTLCTETSSAMACVGMLSPPAPPELCIPTSF